MGPSAKGARIDCAVGNIATLYELYTTDGNRTSGLILSGFLVWGAQQEHVPALQYYKSAITVLEWGLHTWPNVPNSERGAIFSETFVRGVRRLYLDVYLSVCTLLYGTCLRPHGA